MMISPILREETLDLTHEALGPGWLRRSETMPEQHEFVAPDVWRTGPQLRFRDKLVSALHEAKELALLASFLLADDSVAEAMITAAERGVRVYVLTASEQRIGKLTEEDESFEQRMAEQHKGLLAKLAGKVIVRSAEHIHAKFLIVDPHLEHEARAWLSTANFNKALQDSIELGVQLQAASARALAACFNWAFWSEAQRELRGPNRLVEIKANHPACPKRPSDTSVFATLRDGTNLRDQVVTLIRSAKQEILAASYGIDANHIVVRELVEAARRGVKVTVLTRPRPAVAAGVATLAQAGVSVLAHDKLHAKALVVDGKALVMTANFDAHGLDTGFEVGALLSADATHGVEKTLREWAEAFPWVYRFNATRGEHNGDFCTSTKGLRDGIIKVVPLRRQIAADVVAFDALSLNDAPEPSLVPTPHHNEIPQRVIFSWKVQAPHLPKGATERFQLVERKIQGKDGKPEKTKSKIAFVPPVYDHKNKTYVVLRTSEEAEQARQLATQLTAKVVLQS